MLFLLNTILNGLGMFFVDRKIQKIFSAIGIIILAWLAGTVSVSHSFDTGTYSGAYILGPETSIFEPGYLNLTFWFYNHGISYDQFRIISYFLFYLIFYIIIINFSQNPSFFVFVYSFFPFLNDAVQVRNFFMLGFVGLAIIALEKKSFKRILIAIMLIYISTLFQTTGTMFYLLVVLRMLPFRKVYSIAPKIVISLIIFSLLIWMSGALYLITQHFSKLAVLSDRNGITDALDVYSNGSFNRYSITLICSYILMLIDVHMFVSRRIVDGNLTDKDKILYLTVLLGVIGIPALLSSFAFERVLRNSMIFALLIMTNTSFPAKINKGDGVRYLILGTAVILAIYAKGYLNNSPGMMGSYLPYMLHFLK